ncbi:MAG: flagellar motor switch protein FliM [Burkholderiales bacterium]
MSKDFLSQDEVDALLQDVTGEDEANPGPEPLDGVRPYDLAAQERIVRGRMPVLETINERCARLLRTGFFNLVRLTAEISTSPVKLQKYSEFVRNLVVPASLNLMQVKPLHGTALLVFDPVLVFLIVDNMFGGNGKFQTRAEDRDFTQTEQRIIKKILGVVTEGLEKSWAPVHPVTFEFMRSETNTQFANIATPNQVVVVTKFSIEFGADGGDIYFCLPYSMIEPIREQLSNPLQSEKAETDKQWTRRLSREVQAADIEIVVNLGQAEVSIQQLMAMQVGDVIGLDIPQPLTAEVDGVPVMECKCGILNGQYALRVERMLAAGAE